MARLNWYGQPLKYGHFLLCPKRSVLIGQGSTFTPINEVEQSLRRDQSFEAMEQAVLSLSLDITQKPEVHISGFVLWALHFVCDQMMRMPEIL